MKEDERNMLDDAIDALSAQGAWRGHCYSFQYMEEYYAPLLKIAKKLKVSTKWLEKVHSDVTSEYQELAENEDKSFMNEEDELRMSLLDDFYFEALSLVCKNISEKAEA